MSELLDNMMKDVALLRNHKLAYVLFTPEEHAKFVVEVKLANIRHQSRIRLFQGIPILVYEPAELIIRMAELFAKGYEVIRFKDLE